MSTIRDHNGDPIDYREVGPIDPAPSHADCTDPECYRCQLVAQLRADGDPFGVGTSREMSREELQAREDDAAADADWGFEPPC